MASAKRDRLSRWEDAMSGRRAVGIITAAWISAPVLRMNMSSTAARSGLRPSNWRSRAWPPAMPTTPQARASSRDMLREASASGTAVSTSKANACSASPARMAVASSKAR